MDISTKLETLRRTIEEQQRARLVADGMSSLLLGSHYTGSIKMGRKYANIDFGGSGKYMVDLATGEIFGIKAYGVIHRGHRFGTLDTIEAWDWSNYRAVRKAVQS
jgi:hypothetical protein